jgi:hypothetical protein
MKRSIIILHGAVLSACMLLSCTGMNIAGGGNSSGTGNGAIVCAASDRIEGVTRPMARVLLYSRDWMPLLDSGTFSDSSRADDSGKFTFADVPHGYYDLIIFSVGEKGAGIFKNVPCQPAVTWADTIDTLKEPGFLHGYETSAQNDTLALSYIYIKGTPFHAMTDTRGEFLMGPLPPSGYTFQIYGLFTTNAGGPVKAIPNLSAQGTLAGGAITDSIPVIIYPDSIVQLAR